MNQVLRGASPSEVALLVIDKQNDFCSSFGYLQKIKGKDVSFATDVVEKIDRLIQGVRNTGTPIIWVRSYYDFEYLPEAHRMQRGSEGVCLKGTWGAEFFGTQPSDGEKIITKHTFSAFHGTDLGQYLESIGIKTLAFTGVATNVCVDSSLRDGFFAGYNVLLLEDCVGSSNPVGHEGTLATVRTNFGQVVDSQELLDVLS